jgi:hypothetical protein
MIKKLLVLFLLSSTIANAQVAGTPPTFTCPASNWISALKGSSPPVCTQPNLTDILFSFIELSEIAEPATPATNNLRVFAVDQSGFERLQMKTSDGVVGTITEDAFVMVRNVGALIPEDTVVYISGATGNIPEVSPAKADSATTMPALGVIVNDIDTDEFGKAQVAGTYSKFNTNSWDDGDRLFISAATAGAITNIAPVHPNLQQRIGTVLKKAAGNGGIIQVLPLSQRGDEDGTNQASFTIGTTENASMVLSPSSTAQRTFGYPDLSGDVCVYQRGDVTWGSGTPFNWTFDAGTDKPKFEFDDNVMGFSGVKTYTFFPSAGQQLTLRFNTYQNSQVFDQRRANGSRGDEMALAEGDEIASWRIRGHDGDNYTTGASITATVDGEVSLGVLPTKLEFQTKDLTGSLATRMAIDVNGNIRLKNLMA